MALTNKLTAIGDAIRAKTGTTEAMTLDEMATAISGITTGSGGESTDFIPESAYTFTGTCNYMDIDGRWDWFIEKFRKPAYTIEIGKGKNPLPVESFENIYAKIKNALYMSALT